MNWLKTFKKCVETAKMADLPTQDVTESNKNFWEDICESYGFDLEDVACVITNDYVNKDGSLFLEAVYYSKNGNELFVSPNYNTIKDCLRDNAIFVNSKRMCLEFFGDFKE
jgi:hypothetical protein